MNWDKLSIKDKAAVMKVAVRNGIYDLNDIRKQYHKFDGDSTVTSQLNSPLNNYDTWSAINSLPSRDQLTPEQRKQENIAAINDWARQNPANVFGSNFRAQRQYITPETWQYVIANQNNPISNYNDPRLSMMPKNISEQLQSSNFNTGIRENTNKVAQTIAETGLATAAFLPVAGNAMDIADVVTPLATGNYVQAAINAGMMLVPEWAEKPIKRGISKALTNRYIKKQLNNIENNVFNNLEIPNHHLTGLSIPNLGTNNVDNTAFIINQDKLRVQADRNFLKEFNQKFNRYHGYKAIDLNLSKKVGAAEEAVKQRLKEHNTFVRGVSDFASKNNKLTDAEKEFQRKQMRAAGYNPDKREDRLKYSAIFPAPSFERYGRADVNNDLYAKITNGQLTDSKGNPLNGRPALGTIYTSNNLDTAKGYHYNDGEVAVVSRPYSLGPDRNLWYKEADFVATEKNNSGNKYLNQKLYEELYGVPYNQELYNTRKQILNTLFGKHTDIEKIVEQLELKNKYGIHQYDDPIYDYMKSYMESDDVRYLLKGSKVSLPNNGKMNNYLDFVRNSLMIEDLQNVGHLRKGIKYRDEAMRHIKNANRERIRDIWKEAEKQLYIPVDNKGFINPEIEQYPVTIPNLRSNRVSNNTYSHYVFTGPINETPLLNFEGFVNENTFPEYYKYIGEIAWPQIAFWKL